MTRLWIVFGELKYYAPKRFALSNLQPGVVDAMPQKQVLVQRIETHQER